MVDQWPVSNLFFFQFQKNNSYNNKENNNRIYSVQLRFEQHKQKKQRQKSNDKENLKGKNFENFLFYNIYI